MAPVDNYGMTTTFTNDATKIVVDNRKELFKGVGPGVEDAQTIKMFLAKPYKVTTIRLLEAQPRNSILFNEDIRTLLLNHASYRNKLQGYALVRGTAVITIMLNAMPFHAGRWITHFLPQYAFRVANGTQFTMHNGTLGSKTQQYNVEIDARDSSCELRIPFISPYAYSNITGEYTSETSWGNVFVSVLSPLVSITSPGPDMNIYIHFEDMELAAPTASPVPQMRKPVKPRAIVKEKEVIDNKGPVTSTLDAIQKGVDYFKPIPFLSEYASLSSTVLSGAKTISSAFGWSKPVNNVAPTITLLQAAKNLNTSDGSNNSHKLALDSANSLVPLDSADGTTIDEMSFSFLKKIPSYVANFAWSSTSTVGTPIYTQFIAPQFLRQDANLSNGVRTMPTSTFPPFAFLSRYFQYYRGSIDVTFKFVKTQFHSGRLEILFDPNLAVSSTDMAASSTVLREVIDLKDSNTVTLNLPYLNAQNYLDMNRSMGQIRVIPLTPLAFADTVANSIDIMVYYSAGDDFEIAYPVATDINPVVGITPQMNVVKPQLVHKRVGGYPESDLSLMPLKTCMGEAFTSVKQLISASRQIRLTTNSWNPTTWNNSGLTNTLSVTTVLFDPYVFGIPAVNATIGQVSVPVHYGDYLSELSTGYAFFRGGIRYTAPGLNSEGFSTVTTYKRPNTTNPWVTNIAPVYRNAANTVQTFAQAALNISNTCLQVVRNNTIFDFTVPYYGKTPFRFIHNVYGNVSPPNASEDDPCSVLISNYTNTNSSLDARDVLISQPWYRSGADDFQFLYFIGFPPVSNGPTV